MLKGLNNTITIDFDIILYTKICRFAAIGNYEIFTLDNVLQIS